MSRRASPFAASLVAVAWCAACSGAPPQPAQPASSVTPPPAATPSPLPAPAPPSTPTADETREAPAPSATPAPHDAQEGAAPVPEPHFVERLAHLRGTLVYQDGAPASHLPIAIDDGCETLATFTDEKGRFAFDDVALPASFRSLENFMLSTVRTGENLMEAVPLEPTPAVLRAGRAGGRPGKATGASRQIAPIAVDGRKAVTYLADNPSTPESVDFMNTIDLLGMGPDHGSVIVRARPLQVERARKLGFTVAVLAGDGNHYVADARRATSAEAWSETVSGRVASARAAWELAELGASRKPQSRVRVDEDCVARASASMPGPAEKAGQAP